MGKVVVNIKDLSHRYSKDWAVKDINFDVQKNEILGLLGSNGAGKSTTMNILCGVLKPTKGIVKVNGIDIRVNPVEAKRLIGFLPQKAPIYSEFTVYEYLKYTAKLRKLPPGIITSAVQRAMERCDIVHFRNRLISNLSGGYQQRVGIAQAIVHEPLLVVLDEPTNGLDPVQIIEVRKLIKEIGDDHAVILSTHILSEVEAICDSVNMIEKGHLVFTGTLNEFKDYVKPDSIIMEFLDKPDGSIIKSLNGVTEVSELEGLKYRIKFDTKNPITEDLIRISVKKNLKLSEIYVEKSNLEEVFARISQNNISDI